jgi:hypothetical protein
LRGADATAIAPIAASWIIAAHWIVRSQPLPHELLVQAGLVLTIGWMLGARRPPVEPADATPAGAPVRESDDVEVLDLREKFRRLREQYAELQRESRMNAFIARIHQLGERADSHRGDGRARRAWLCTPRRRAETA